MIKNSSMKAIALIVLACFSLSSCATLDLKMTRKKYASEKYRKKVQDIADLRSQQISENNTFYGKKLQCLSDMHKDFFMVPTGRIAKRNNDGKRKVPHFGRSDAG